MTHNETLRIETGCHQKAAVSHLRPETGVLPLRVHLELWSLQLYASALQPTHPSHFIITNPLILVQWRQYSRARTIDPSEACDSEVTIPMPPLSTLGASWERVLIPQPDASYEPRVLRKLSGLSHPTNFSAPSPPVDPVEQLLPRSFSTTLSLLPSCCRRLQTYRHSVAWADDHTCSDCHAVDHMGWPTSSASISHTCKERISPRGICGRHPSRSFISWRAPTVCWSASNPDRFRLLPLFTLFWK